MRFAHTFHMFSRPAPLLRNIFLRCCYGGVWGMNGWVWDHALAYGGVWGMNGWVWDHALAYGGVWGMNGWVWDHAIAYGGVWGMNGWVWDHAIAYGGVWGMNGWVWDHAIAYGGVWGMNDLGMRPCSSLWWSLGHEWPGYETMLQLMVESGAWMTWVWDHALAYGGVWGMNGWVWDHALAYGGVRGMNDLGMRPCSSL